MIKSMEKLGKFGRIAGIAIIVLFAIPILALAQQTGAGPAAQPSNFTAPPQSSINTVQAVLNDICGVFDWMFYFLIALSVIFIVIAAYRYLTASGEPEKVKKATNTIIYAAIAVAVALLALAIPSIVANFLNASGNLGNCGGSSGSTASTSNYNPNSANNSY
jgi:uncharacterized membrane protein